MIPCSDMNFYLDFLQKTMDNITCEGQYMHAPYSPEY